MRQLPPDLAASLTNYGVRLAATCLRSAGNVDHIRELAAASPDGYRPFLPVSWATSVFGWPT